MTGLVCWYIIQRFSIDSIILGLHMECLVSGLNVVSCTLGAAELPWFPLSSEAGLTAENFANLKKMKAANKYEKVDKMEDTKQSKSLVCEDRPWLE